MLQSKSLILLSDSLEGILGVDFDEGQGGALAIILLHHGFAAWRQGAGSGAGPTMGGFQSCKEVC